MKYSLKAIVVISASWIFPGLVNSFMIAPSSSFATTTSQQYITRSSTMMMARRRTPELFEDDEDMIPIAEAYIHAKYKQVAASHGHNVANRKDVLEVLHSILPPVTSEELKKEEESIMKSLLSHEKNSADAIDEDDFVKSMIQNSYWKEAGDVVVKELMYFDSLHSYYTTGKPLLDDDNYDELHDNLTWEGSSVATMSADEIKFVSAVAAAKRGEPMMDDEEYLALKSGLKENGSWVVNREQDALEKNGLNTFMGYLHRSM